MTATASSSGSIRIEVDNNGMAKFPALPLFTDAWMADTRHLSRIARDIYMELLILIWRSPGCRVPNDIKWISNRLQVSDPERPILKEVVAEFCAHPIQKGSSQWLTQKRLNKEYNFIIRKRSKQISSAKARWNKEKGLSERNAPHPTPLKGGVDPTLKEGARPLASPETASGSAPLPKKPDRAELSEEERRAVVQKTLGRNVPPGRIARPRPTVEHEREANEFIHSMHKERR